MGATETRCSAYRRYSLVDRQPEYSYSQCVEGTINMELTHVEAMAANPAHPRKTKKLSLLVDSGTVYSVVPKTVLGALGVKSHSTKTFTLADGSKIKRKVGDLAFKLNGHQGASPVIFGEKEDSTLLGTVSLEALGLLHDPSRRELRPLPMVLGAHEPRQPRSSR